MVTVLTRDFGEKPVEEQDIFTFPSGIPGFEHFTRFVFLHPEESAPFSFMQSMDEPELVFIVTDPFLFYPQYEFSLTDKMMKELEIEREEDVAVWVIVSIADPASASTANLLAPLIVNRRSQAGKQMILHNSAYKTKHPLLLAKQVETMTEGD